MQSLTSGTMAGAGSFRCQRCGYVLTLLATDSLSDCPECSGQSFTRASLFSAAAPVGGDELPDTQIKATHEDRDALVSDARERIEEPGEYLAYEQAGELTIVALTREWTRIGRSLAADIRFDDPTVSRRHALIVRHADGVRVLDDRSLNGVFVNGERVEWRVLQDEDQILVGRYELSFLRMRGGIGASRVSGAASTQA
jgi:DNA-directed RNA polymerase subunit RPC12/RpoP